MSRPGPTFDEQYWKLPPEDLLARLGSGPQGLGKAAARLARYGANCLSEERRMPRQVAYRREDEKDLELAGFLLCLDPPQAQAPRVLADFARLGVAVKMSTGDNRHIAAHVALAAVLGITAAYVLVTELAKRVFYRFPTSENPARGWRAPRRPA
jgi:magnesium-transporting ATPase (P-type)